MKKITNIILDFDGTLVDSMPVYAAMMRGILDEQQVAYGEDIIKIITPCIKLSLLFFLICPSLFY